MREFIRLGDQQCGGCGSREVRCLFRTDASWRGIEAGCCHRAWVVEGDPVWCGECWCQGRMMKRDGWYEVYWGEACAKCYRERRKE
jgi:hypothetical protein